MNAKNQTANKNKVFLLLQPISKNGHDSRSNFLRIETSASDEIL